MLMELRDLRSFLAVVRCGSFTVAADELGYTQSAVSQQVAALELELGHQLLQRRPVRPTPVGERLVEHATRILLRVDVARSELAKLDDVPPALVVAACPLAAPGLLASALRELRSTAPSMKVTVRSIDPASAAAEVASRSCRPVAGGRDHRSGRAAQRRRRRPPVVDRARGSPTGGGASRRPPVAQPNEHQPRGARGRPVDRRAGSCHTERRPPAPARDAGRSASGRLRRQRSPDVARPRRCRARRSAAPGTVLRSRRRHRQHSARPPATRPSHRIGDASGPSVSGRAARRSAPIEGIARSGLTARVRRAPSPFGAPGRTPGGGRPRRPRSLLRSSPRPESRPR